MKVHRSDFMIRSMCRILQVHPSGFYAWLKSPLSKRALEDQRQTELIKQAWEESGKVYGYRKLHDDLCELGEFISPNRVARLAHLAGILLRSDINVALANMEENRLLLLIIHLIDNLMFWNQIDFG